MELLRVALVSAEAKFGKSDGADAEFGRLVVDNARSDVPLSAEREANGVGVEHVLESFEGVSRISWAPGLRALNVFGPGTKAAEQGGRPLVDGLQNDFASFPMNHDLVLILRETAGTGQTDGLAAAMSWARAMPTPRCCASSAAARWRNLPSRRIR